MRLSEDKAVKQALEKRGEFRAASLPLSPADLQSGGIVFILR
jgi:hypothetical protein